MGYCVSKGDNAAGRVRLTPFSKRKQLKQKGLFSTLRALAVGSSSRAADTNLGV